MGEKVDTFVEHFLFVITVLRAIYQANIVVIVTLEQNIKIQIFRTKLIDKQADR